MSYCNKLKKLPRSIGKLKKVRTLSLDGCLDIGEIPNEMKDMESLEVLTVPNISINSLASSSVVVESVPRTLKVFIPLLPPSLVTLSLENNNLVTESFPMDLSSLSMLKKLYLDGNLIVSLPNCLRSLSGLEFLSLNRCDKLKTVKDPPGTLTRLQLAKCSSLLKIAFDPEMSTPTPPFMEYPLPESLNEIEGIFIIQPIAHVEEEVLHSLGWTNLEFAEDQKVEVWNPMKWLGLKLPVQMCYEFGIFSTFYGGKEVPKWINRRSKGSSISFTMPSSHDNLRGLNICSVHSTSSIKKEVYLSYIKISNITKNRTWIYTHYIYWFKVVKQECVVWLSHWMFGKNEMEDGDQVTVTVTKDEKYGAKVSVRKCGVSLLYDDGNMEEDPLGYYKSWNHIIGGDLSGFQLTTGEYLLTNFRFFMIPKNLTNHIMIS